MRLLRFNRFPAKQLPQNLLLVLLISSAFFTLPIIALALTYVGYLYFTGVVDTLLYITVFQVLGLTVVWVLANTFTIWVLTGLGRWVQTMFIPNRDRIEPLSLWGDIRHLLNPGPGGIRQAARHRLPPNFLRLMFWNMLIGEVIILLPMMLIYRWRTGPFTPENIKTGLFMLVLVTAGATFVSVLITGLGNSIGRWFFGSNEGTPGDYMVSYNLDDIENIR